MDDMACVYSQEEGFSEGKRRGLVLKDNVNGPTKRSYSVHTPASESSSKKFKGVKGRYTTLLADSGHMGPIWLQFPGLSDEEMPPDKVPKGYIIMPVEGLTLDGNINPHSKEIGYIVWMRKGAGIETAMFAEYEKIIRMKFSDAMLTKHGIDPNDKIPDYARCLITKDGGMTQLSATMDEDSFGMMHARNEISAKLAKNTSQNAQPADTGDGHMNQRRELRKLSKQPTPLLAMLPHYDKAVQELRNVGKLVLDAQKLSEYRGMVARSPNAIRNAYNEKKNMESFVRPGWLDKETLQGPDLIQLFHALKQVWTVEEREKWERDIPHFIKEMHYFGHIAEKSFDLRHYQIDTDGAGNFYPLEANMITQHHRQRFTIPNHHYLYESLMIQTENVKDDEQKKLEEEMIKREAILKANKKTEGLIHTGASRPLDSDRSLIASNPPKLEQLLKLRQVNLTPFVAARSLTSSNSMKIPTKVGNVKEVTATLRKLQDNPNYKLDKKEDCLLLRAHNLCSVVDLPLKIEAVEQMIVEGVSTDENASTAQQEMSILPIVRSGFHLNKHSFMLDPQLLQEASNCFINKNFATSVTNSMKSMRDALASKIPPRLERFKVMRLKGLSHLINHWAINAFEENILALCEVIVLSKLVPKSIGAIAIGKSLFRPTCSGYYEKALDKSRSSYQGVAIFHDKERGVFVHTTKVDGADDNNFEKEYTKHETNSKADASSSKFSSGYPFSKPRSSLQGKSKGTFPDLEMLIGVAIDPKGSNDCLTREKDGLFFWSERTLHKLRESSGSDVLRQKQMKLVLCMIGLFVNLMLDFDEELSDGSFMENFMGAFNLA